MIHFDVVVPTKKGVVYAVGSYEVDVRVSVNNAHCLLGQRNEDTIQKTSKNLDGS